MPGLGVLSIRLRDRATVRGLMTVEVPLDRVYLPRGKNSGTVKVLGERTLQRRSFTLQISR